MRKTNQTMATSRHMSEVKLWSKDRQLELAAIQGRLETGGPETMGLVKSELEGVPNWRDLSTPYFRWRCICRRVGRF